MLVKMEECFPNKPEEDQKSKQFDWGMAGGKHATCTL